MAAIRLLLAVAAVIAIYLAWVSFTGRAMVGCGPASGCEKVLHSRWAYWLGVPVSLLAVPLYVFLFFAPQRPHLTHLTYLTSAACALSLVGAAAYFVFLQASVIHAFCRFCVSAHLAGAIAAILILKGSAIPLPRPATAAATLLALLFAGQFFAAPKTFVVTAIPATTNVVPALPTGRLLPIYAGQFQLPVEEVPIWGSSTAPHIIVSLFDYTCHHCRLMHPRLVEVRRTFSNQLAIISLPMPLDPVCNTNVLRQHPDHVNACAYARIGLAVWRARPGALLQFDDWIFAPERPPPVSEAREHASQLAGMMAFEQAMADPWIDRQIRRAIEIYEAAYRAGQGSMPQIIVSNKVAVGALPSESLYQLLGAEFGLRATTVK